MQVIRDKRKIKKALLKKGFEKEESTHHTYFVFYTKDGIKTNVNTHVSRGRDTKDLSYHLLDQMAKQCILSNKDFRKLINCSLTQMEYENLVFKNNDEPLPSGHRM